MAERFRAPPHQWRLLTPEPSPRFRLVRVRCWRGSSRLAGSRVSWGSSKTRPGRWRCRLRVCETRCELRKGTRSTCTRFFRWSW